MSMTSSVKTVETSAASEPVATATENAPVPVATEDASVPAVTEDVPTASVATESVAATDIRKAAAQQHIVDEKYTQLLKKKNAHKGKMSYQLVNYIIGAALTGTADWHVNDPDSFIEKTSPTDEEKSTFKKHVEALYLKSYNKGLLKRFANKTFIKYDTPPPGSKDFNSGKKMPAYKMYWSGFETDDTGMPISGDDGAMVFHDVEKDSTPIVLLLHGPNRGKITGQAAFAKFGLTTGMIQLKNFMAPLGFHVFQTRYCLHFVHELNLETYKSGKSTTRGTSGRRTGGRR